MSRAVRDDWANENRIPALSYRDEAGMDALCCSPNRLARAALRDMSTIVTRRPAPHVDAADPNVAAGDPSVTGSTITFDAQLAELAIQPSMAKPLIPETPWGISPQISRHGMPPPGSSTLLFGRASQTPHYYPGPNGLPHAAHLQPQHVAPFYQTHTNFGWAATDVPPTQADYQPMNAGSFGGQWASPFAAAAPAGCRFI
ncbi:hypothetical protein AURDEDRAFT_166364 [Auricularia subglabra TFB-10046 SS5]|uniref:Uncharacterized protein n=1 Tax=Auricularia subglabra (strain TFB-10046 / SS5) TaxID=717982 RepID=J0DDP4_AURST|nr:hypothetical protein AURDEDRAFT_166364 [Auricularia subglabra TFB-10046 SS5]